MTILKSVLSWFVLLALICCQYPLQAADRPECRVDIDSILAIPPEYDTSDKERSKYVSKKVERLLRSCYEIQSIEAQWAKNVDETLLSIDIESDTAVDQLGKFTNTLSLIENELGNRENLLFLSKYLEIIHALNYQLNQLPTGDNLGLHGDRNVFTRSGGYLIRGGFNFDEVIAADCYSADADKVTCRTRVEEVAASFPIFSALDALNAVITQLNALPILDQLELLDQRWTAYFDDAMSQNFMELFINSNYFSPKSKNGEFARVPNKQLIFMHPRIGLEYIDTESDGDRFEEALVIEVIGLNRWEWRGAKMHRPIGLSLIGSYSERQTGDDLAWGVMAHYKNKYSLGLTRRDGDTGVFLSLDLQSLFTQWSEEKKEKFAAYKRVKDKIRSSLDR